MGFSKAAFVLVLSAALSLAISDPRPNNFRKSNDPLLLHRDTNASVGTSNFQYSPSWFNTKSQASLWKAALKVNAGTRALLFSPDSTILEDTLESNDTLRFGKFLDQIFANNLAGDEVHTRRSRRGADNDEPPDPIEFEEGRWRMGFGDYDLYGNKISGVVATSIALMSYAQIGTEMIVNVHSPLSSYPSTRYSQNLFPPGSHRVISYTLEGPVRFYYEDLLMSLKLFISWTGSWTPDQERRVPSTSMALKKEYNPMRITEIATGRFLIQGAGQP